MSSYDDDYVWFRGARLHIYEAEPGNMAGATGWFCNWTFPGINPPLTGKANARKKSEAQRLAMDAVNEVYAAVSRMNTERASAASGVSCRLKEHIDTLATAASGFDAAKTLLEKSEDEKRRWEHAARRLYAALQGARQFISNGIDFGYIRLPDDDTPDLAKQTLPAIEEVLHQYWTLITDGNLMTTVKA